MAGSLYRSVLTLDRFTDLAKSVTSFGPYAEDRSTHSELRDQGSIDFGILGRMHSEQDLERLHGHNLLSRAIAKNFTQLSTYLDNVWLNTPNESDSKDPIQVNAGKVALIGNDPMADARHCRIGNQDFQEKRISGELANQLKKAEEDRWDQDSLVHTLKFQNTAIKQKVDIELGLRPGRDETIEAQVVTDTSTGGGAAFKPGSKIEHLDAEATDELINLLNVRAGDLQASPV